NHLGHAEASPESILAQPLVQLIRQENGRALHICIVAYMCQLQVRLWDRSLSHFWTAASRVRSAQKLAPSVADAERRNPRRPVAECGCMPPILLPADAA